MAFVSTISLLIKPAAGHIVHEGAVLHSIPPWDRRLLITSTKDPGGLVLLCIDEGLYCHH